MRTPFVVLVLACIACGAPAPSPSMTRVGPSPPATGRATASRTLVAAPVPAASASAAPTEWLGAADATTADAGAAAPSCPTGEVWVPPTSADGFVMSKGIKGEHRVILTRGFCMDAGEVSVRDYVKCMDAGTCTEPWRGDPQSTYPSKLDYPVNMVSWNKARAYCTWAGKRLPSEAEWEWAATGPDQTRYPWGDEPEPSCEYVDYTKFGAPKWAAGADVGCGGGGPSPVGSHPRGDKVWPGGALHDLAGNVWEWVEDSFAPFAADTVTDPVVRTDAAVHGLRGGGWNRSYAAMVVTYRGAAAFTYQVPALGFRCVRGGALPAPSPGRE